MRSGRIAVGLAATLLAAMMIAILAARAHEGSDAALPAPRFVEEASAAGVEHLYDGEFDFFVGGGVAVFDCNDDGREELFFAGGEQPAALYRNDTPPGGAFRFTHLADEQTDLLRVTGAYPLDVDSDGNADLAVLRYGENVLLRGTGDCRFERANEAWGFDGGDAWTTAFSATWESTNAWPTIVTGNYLEEFSAETGARCSNHELIRPADDGSSFGTGTVLSPGWCALSMLFSDWDRSGRRDLRVSNDRHYYGDASDGEEQLWRVEAGEAPRLYTRDEGWQTVRVWGMGIASADLTGDGLPEYYLTSQGDNKLQILADGPSQPRYRDIALESGATAHRPYAGDVTMPSTAWHAQFEDVNNDGYLDLFVSKGNVESMPDYAARDPSNLLLGQADGTFVEGAEAAGIVSYARARGAALADLNLDGLLDLVVVNRRENVLVWRNVGSGDTDQPEAMGNWIAIRLAQPEANLDAIGAWIEVRAGDRTGVREVSVGGGHVGGQLGWIHVGLGGHDRADVRVQWPDGEIGPWMPVSANGFVVLERGATEARIWTPAPD
jgi:enediyne biosynthesis protein E4